MKPDSLEYMSGLGNDQHDPNHICDPWKETQVFLALCHRLSANGSSDPCISTTLNSAWSAFRCNVSSSKKVPTGVKLGKMSRVVTPVLSFRWPRWAWTITTARRLDREQRHMLRISYHLRRCSWESPELFSKRLSKHISRVQNEHGKWSVLWAKSICFWAAHVLRNWADSCWANRVLDVRSS